MNVGVGDVGLGVGDHFQRRLNIGAKGDPVFEEQLLLREIVQPVLEGDLERLETDRVGVLIALDPCDLLAGLDPRALHRLTPPRTGDVVELAANLYQDVGRPVGSQASSGRNEGLDRPDRDRLHRHRNDQVDDALHRLFAAAGQRDRGHQKYCR